jgi:hypothetical protein
MSNDNRNPPAGQEEDYEEDYAEEETVEEENRVSAKPRNVIKMPPRKPQSRNRVTA